MWPSFEPASLIPIPNRSLPQLGLSCPEPTNRDTGILVSEAFVRILKLGQARWKEWKSLPARGPSGGPAPRQDDRDWPNELKSTVDELDPLERPFAAYDRIRFGSPSSRDRLSTAARRADL